MKSIVPKETVALRAARIIRDELRHFDAITFARPYAGCEVTVRRCQHFGYVLPALPPKGNVQWVDCLDVDGDIISEIPLTKPGFEYLRRTLRFRMEPNRMEMTS